ncbi:YdeI/OmpD-associated family protein [Fodinibius salsisoli]|uniref:DUF1905 domain-containing protein n=1 Tax=Fodinibius salsisoli TaxID=2820877 RepID=A0ABT3PLW4_9BACT|nr:YdeI/OmpD-associated family protein [Fodinibius salsisoli]MCW9706936.1 DUF1905 domain-containing protein [Fodinibius salsisoli]
MEEETLLVKRTVLLQKFSGKGGWTYVDLPEVSVDSNSPFGWVTVSGTIDGYLLKKHKLMAKGNGKLFLSVNAKIRKKIGKEAGDYVKIQLYRDESAVEIPEEIIRCFEVESPKVKKNFMAFRETEKKAYLDWIYEAQKEETRVRRITEMLDRVSRNEKFYGD